MFARVFGLILRHDVRRHDLAGVHFLNAVGDDELTLLQPLGDFDILAVVGAGGNAPLLHFLGIVDDQHVMAGLIEQHGSLRHQQRVTRLAALDDDADDAARDELAIRIRQLRARGDGIGVGLNLNVEKIRHAGMRINAAVGQPDVNGHMRVLVSGRCDPAPIFDDIGFARLEDDVDRILADDGREYPGRRTDQIADRVVGNTDAAVDRRIDFGVAEIDLGLFEQRLRLQYVSLRRLFGGQVLIDRRLRHVLAFHQFLGALQLQIGIDLGRLRFGDIGRLLVDRRLIYVRLDAKQQIAGLDHLAFGEVALPDETGHARDDIDFVDGYDAADEIAGFGHLPARHRGHRYRRRRARALCRGRIVAAQDNQRNKKRTDHRSHIQSVPY